MKRRILLTVFATAVFTGLLGMLLLAGITYNYVQEDNKENLALQLDYIAKAVEEEGMTYLEGIKDKAFRITWIDKDGDVLFDNRVDKDDMSNHANREEFVEAQKNGTATVERDSETLTKQLIYVAQRLDDGSVVRLAAEKISTIGILWMILKPTIFFFALVIWFALAMAGWLLRRLVEPLDNLNLDNPLANDTYEELTPLLKRMDQQRHEIKLQTKLLSQQREEFQAAVDNMREGFVLLNEKWNIMLINRSVERLFDYKGTSIGSNFLDVSGDDKFRKLLRRVGNGKSSFTAVDFDNRNYEVHASPIFADGQMKGVVLFFIDVTEKREGEQMRREFSANVSHELKTPLHSISGCAELLLNDMVREEDKKQFLQQIYDEAQHMVALVANIISISKLDEADFSNAQENLPVETIDLYEQAKQIVRQLKPSAKLKNISIDIDGESVELKGVTTLIQELVYNLCDNAVKYTPEGGSVSVSVAKKKDEAILRVTDTGCGIPEDEQERIFERFYRVDKSHSRQTGDTGLGLSIVKHAALLHDATIKVKSKVGKGTTMTVRFPLKHKTKEKK